MRNDNDIPRRPAGGFRDGLDKARLRRLALHALAIAFAVVLHTFTTHPPWNTALVCALLALWTVTAIVRHVLAPPWPDVAWSVLLVGGAVCAGLSPTDPSAPAFVGAAGLFLLISAVETPALWISVTLTAGVAGFVVAHDAAGGGPRVAVSVLISATTAGGLGFHGRP
ncbi:hypothetical protein ACFXPZ_05725, partial [Streptomyces sp. NPDC059101]|uniref:hypothetical protein n=1 Tax=Streptomyces sp. NPDC059101 TaxID=3346728 RepID=UPI003693F183